MEQEIIQVLLECMEKYPESNENKKWFTKLIKNSLEGNTEQEIEIDLLYNATIIENILALMLTVDIKTIVKLRIISQIINMIWIENNWNVNLLNSYVLSEKPQFDPRPIPLV